MSVNEFVEQVRTPSASPILLWLDNCCKALRRHGGAAPLEGPEESEGSQSFFQVTYLYLIVFSKLRMPHCYRLMSQMPNVSSDSQYVRMGAGTAVFL